MDEDLAETDLGEVRIRRTREPKSKNKNEYVVTFKSKQVRDEIRAHASNMVNQDLEGMRLHVPDHL